MSRTLQGVLRARDDRPKPEQKIVEGSPHANVAVPIASFTIPQTTILLQPVWDDDQIPPLWHSCSAMSRQGKTKVVPHVREGLSPLDSTREVCPCYGWREIRPDEPPSGWFDRNVARRDPNCPTRRSYHERHPSPYVELI